MNLGTSGLTCFKLQTFWRIFGVKELKNWVLFNCIYSVLFRYGLSLWVSNLYFLDGPNNLYLLQLFVFFYDIKHDTFSPL